MHELSSLQFMTFLPVLGIALVVLEDGLACDSGGPPNP